MTPQEVLALYRELCGSDWVPFAAQGWIESRFQIDAQSPAGARGLAQFTDITWSECIRRKWVPADASPLDPRHAIAGQKAYMVWLEKKMGGYSKALAAYNTGPSRVKEAVDAALRQKAPWLQFVPAETRAYVTAVLALQDWILTFSL